MSALLLALLLAAQSPEAGAAPAVVITEDTPYPPGAPRDDYGLVSWCYGALTGYVELKDQVMPEVTRIESTFRRPGTSLADDLKVYADMEQESRRNLRLFERAMEAAEKASPRPINAQGAAAVQKGRQAWAAAPNLTKARIAQEWMSWSLPVRCTPTAESLERKAKVLGAAFDPTAAADPAPTDAPTDAPAADTPPAPSSAP